MVDVEGQFRVDFRQFHLTPGADAWAEVPLPESLLQHLAATEDHLYMFGKSGGLYRQQPFGTFEHLDIPASVNAVLEHEGRLYAGTNRGVFVSGDVHGWTPLNHGFRVQPDHFARADGATWAWISNSSAAHTTDGGQTWEARYRGFPPRPTIRGLALGADGATWAALFDRGLYRWHEDQWHLADTSVAMQRAYTNRGSALVRTAEGTLLSAALITAQQDVKPASVLHRRVGDTFQPVTDLPGLPAADSVRRLAVDELRAGPDGAVSVQIKAGDTLYHYRSDDDGVTWTQLDATSTD